MKFWEEDRIFEKSVENPPRRTPAQSALNQPIPASKDYVFYDGPPFATGLPHYGHIVGSIMKDVVPRYWTMRGYRVERKWGWDCHGLPIENIVEKELGSKRKKDIEEMGVAKFNELCRTKVLSYVEDWEKVIRRLGRWADMKNAYKTMDLDYMESIWKVFKDLYDKGLIYESHRSMHICPRCETTLSQSEVAEGYMNVKDLSATAKFKLKAGQKIGDFVIDENTFILAWTTTPWTLIGNVALVVKNKSAYSLIEVLESDSDKFKKGEKYIIINDLNIEKKYFGIYENRKYAKDNLFAEKFGDPFLGYNDVYITYYNELNNEFVGVPFNQAKIVTLSKKNIKSTELIGLNYEPLFDYYAKDEKLENRENGWKIYADDFVTTEDGVGVVHIAPAFGEDDMRIGKEHNLPFVQHVSIDGRIKDDNGDFSKEDLTARAKNNPVEVREIDLKIVKYLKEQGKIFSSEKYTHSYPHCWRCDTALLNYATSSWFVAITKFKDEALKTASDINWSPAHIKEGRFGQWLAGARDWSISRQRFWASVMPIWRCEQHVTRNMEHGTEDTKHITHNTQHEINKNTGCGSIKVLGSVKELEDLSGQEVTDLHKHIVDDITFPCEKCGGVMHRVPDVLDTWFDSGSMPYAQMHYPFENKERFEKNFPAEFIAEGIDQCRAWFYYMHAIATALHHKPAFKNVIVNGIVLAEDGKKMSKKLQNYPDPMKLMEQYGTDALRFYLLSSPVMAAENLNFSEKGVMEVLRNNVMTLWNVYKFYELFAEVNNIQYSILDTQQEMRSENVLDQWIVARLNQLIAETTDSMNAYDLPRAVRPITLFINDLSTWYLRRSRDRFKSEDVADREAALATTKFVLLELAKVMAPFTPFISEQIWQKVSGHNFSNPDKSVHLELWAELDDIDVEIIENMKTVREIVELGLSCRDDGKIKVRQPLQAIKIIDQFLSSQYNDQYFELIKDELNVKEIRFAKSVEEVKAKEENWIVKDNDRAVIALCVQITPELKLEGVKRELVRFINAMRKDMNLSLNDRAEVFYETNSELVRECIEKFAADIMNDTLSESLKFGLDSVEVKKEVKIDGEVVVLGIVKKS